MQMNKLTSRKFWISVAAFLGSVAASIAGLAISDPTVTTVGIICGVLSAAIYAASEAYVDGAAVAANTTATNKTITATSNNVNSIVQAALQSEVPAEEKSAT